jgi:hypothetical protein
MLFCTKIVYMKTKRIFNLKLLLTAISLLALSGCATDFPIKTAHPEVNDNSEDEASVSESPEAVKETPVNDTVDESKVSPKDSSVPTVPKSTTTRKVELNLELQDIQKLAYELGLDPKKPLSDNEKAMIADRQRLRELERSLNSPNERLQYSKVLPWLKGDQEKIDLLSIPTTEGRQVWINKNKIWSRAKSLVEFDEVVESQDIALGMPTEYVKKSWGEPDHVETSGNPIYRNERWQYNRQVATPQGYKLEKRLVYFEGGRVVGWETE